MAQNPKPKPCPICKKKPAASEFVPFCSEQCRLIDLGHWLDGKYTVPDQATPGGSGSNLEPPSDIFDDKQKS